MDHIAPNPALRKACYALAIALLVSLWFNLLLAFERPRMDSGGKTARPAHDTRKPAKPGPQRLVV